MKLKLRPRILAVWLTLSTTTLAIIPGVAEAQGNLATESIGTVQGVNADPNLNTQAAAADSQNNLSDGSTNGPASGGSADPSGGTNSANESIGTVQDVNASPETNTQVAVPDSENNISSGGGSSENGGSGNSSGYDNNADGSIGTVRGSCRMFSE